MHVALKCGNEYDGYMRYSCSTDRIKEKKIFLLNIAFHNKMNTLPSTAMNLLITKDVFLNIKN